MYSTQTISRVAIFEQHHSNACTHYAFPVSNYWLHQTISQFLRIKYIHVWCILLQRQHTNAVQYNSYNYLSFGSCDTCVTTMKTWLWRWYKNVRHTQWVMFVVFKLKTGAHVQSEKSAHNRWKCEDHWRPTTQKVDWHMVPVLSCPGEEG